jgi:hypothetical protein
MCCLSTFHLGLSHEAPLSDVLGDGAHLVWPNCSCRTCLHARLLLVLLFHSLAVFLTILHPAFLPPPPVVVQELLSMPAHNANLRAEGLLAQWNFPNNYTLSKHLAEYMVADYQKYFNLPVAIMRPTLISSCARDPYPGRCSCALTDSCVLMAAMTLLPAWSGVIAYVVGHLAHNAPAGLTALMHRQHCKGGCGSCLLPLSSTSISPLLCHCPS